MVAPRIRFVQWLPVAAGAAGLLLPQSLAAQGVAESLSREVVQPLPPAATGDLTEALRRIAINPQDADALMMAGRASLKLEDTDAAMGFFTRARDTGATGGMAKAGLAAALVYRKMPIEALKLFAEADAEGASPESFASDYGLALDLVGDNVRAQTYYRIALRDRSDDEVTRRLALSQAIGGDQAASEMTLLPQLQRRDLAAYRARAFALAALGQTEEAVTIAQAIMPASLAARIAPYLRYMPRLTRAQQAAAANFGHFPEASAIGKDDPRIAELARAAGGARVVSSPAGGRLVPAGEPLGPSPAPTPAPPPPVAIAVVEPEPPPQEMPPPVELAAVQDEGPAGVIELPPEPEPAEEFPVVAATEQNAELPGPSFSIALAEPEQVAEESGIVFDLANVADNRSGTISSAEIAQELPPAVAQSEPEPEPEPMPPPVAAPPPAPVSLADAFADFGPPVAQANPASGAVDISAIEILREAKPEPPKPVVPSRIWVQVATGRDRSALAFDWRRIVREGGATMQGKSAFIARWGQTNRLVTGPFSNRQQAQAFVASLKQAGLDSFMFVSDEGEAVDPLARR
jgi:tetratricopeptide (TPR) repeat protein